MVIQTRLYEILARHKNAGNRIAMQALADACDVSYITLWRWANGHTASTNHELLAALCRELNVTPGDLLVYVPDPAIAPDGRDGQESEAVPA